MAAHYGRSPRAVNPGPQAPNLGGTYGDFGGTFAQIPPRRTSWRADIENQVFPRKVKACGGHTGRQNEAPKHAPPDW